MCSSDLDPHFLSFIEYKTPDKLKFTRIDADVDGALKSGEAEEDAVLADIFKNAVKDEKLTIKPEALKNADVPAVIVVDEYMRRYSEMGRMYGMSEGELNKTLIVNTANTAVTRLKTLDEERRDLAAEYIYLLALSSYRKLTPEESDKFLGYSVKMLGEYIK